MFKNQNQESDLVVFIGHSSDANKLVERVLQKSDQIRTIFRQLNHHCICKKFTSIQFVDWRNMKRPFPGGQDMYINPQLDTCHIGLFPIFNRLGNWTLIEIKTITNRKKVPIICIFPSDTYILNQKHWNDAEWKSVETFRKINYSQFTDPQSMSLDVGIEYSSFDNFDYQVLYNLVVALSTYICKKCNPPNYPAFFVYILQCTINYTDTSEEFSELSESEKKMILKIIIQIFKDVLLINMSNSLYNDLSDNLYNHSTIKSNEKVKQLIHELRTANAFYGHAGSETIKSKQRLLDYLLQLGFPNHKIQELISSVVAEKLDTLALPDPAHDPKN